MSNEMIYRQDAINALGEEPEVWSENDEYAQGLNNQWHYDVNAIKALPPAQPEQRWILCSERLPELNSRCVLLYGNDNISGGYYRGNRTFDVDYGDEDVKTMVIAWMLLPEPYAKRSSE